MSPNGPDRGVPGDGAIVEADGMDLVEDLYQVDHSLAHLLLKTTHQLATPLLVVSPQPEAIQLSQTDITRLALC